MNKILYSYDFTNRQVDESLIEKETAKIYTIKRDTTSFGLKHNIRLYKDDRQLVFDKNKSEVIRKALSKLKDKKAELLREVSEIESHIDQLTKSGEGLNNEN